MNYQKELKIVAIAKEAGFDDDALAYTEFCLSKFFDLVVERCATIAELQANSYTGENNEAAGCKKAATAIRLFGKKAE